MKLRLEADQRSNKIGFRLDYDELTALLTSGEISECLALPDAHLSYTIVCLPAGSKAEFTTNEYSFNLSLARDVIESHRAELPCLKGIVTEFPGHDGSRLMVSLEVNLKKKLKRSLSHNNDIPQGRQA